MGSSIDGLEGGPADFAEQPAGEEVALTSHSSGHVGIQVIGVQACEDVLTHPLHPLGAWCEDNVLLLYGDVDTLYLVCVGWWLSFRWLHPVAQRTVEIFEGLEAR